MGEFLFQRRVRWEDCDSAQIIYYANYFKYLEQAEEEMFRASPWSYKDLKAKYNATISKLESECRYRSPAVYDDLLEVHSAYSDLDGSRFTNHFQIKRGGETLASGYVKCVCRRRDGTLGDEVPLPPEMEQIIRRHLRSAS
ncbi:MAG: acyl-CoA thioesterase [Candidatus Tectomicrobia bacterium]|nr:acyl-CoA thioesterase [Candidatus Tectomicrobia bacterium]